MARATARGKGRGRGCRSAASPGARLRCKTGVPQGVGAPPRGAATAYVNACSRCGCSPDLSVAADLAERGALIVDLRLCTSEALAALCVLLREAPAGIRQLVFRDGLASLGSDPSYRERVEAHRRRRQPGALAVAPLRLLIAALVSFLAARGGNVTVFDLAGAPLGQDFTSLFTPLVAALRGCRMRCLQWLNLAGCRLGDRGLALLLPWLAGADNALPRLEALVLAWNGLADVRLLDALLRARARLCFERRAAPMGLLDISGNSRLCASGLRAPADAAGREAAAPPRSRRRPGTASTHSGAGARPQHGGGRGGGRCGALVSALACALAEGLPLQVLRLQRMHLDDEAMQPLLRLLQAEARRCVSSSGVLAAASGFRLEQLDLTGNHLSPVLRAAAANALDMLASIRSHIWSDPACAPHQAATEAASAMEEPPAEEQSSIQLSHRASAPRLLRRARSEPALGRQPLGLEALTRDALSDGGEDASAEGPSSREDFLLRRAEDKRSFRRAAATLAPRRPRSSRASAQPLPGAWPPQGLEAREEAQLAIAGALGAAASELWVRQAVYEELRAPASAQPAAPQLGAEISPPLAAGRELLGRAALSRAPPQGWAEEWMAEASQEVEDSAEEAWLHRGALSSDGSSDELEGSSEFQEVLADRLGALRAAVVESLPGAGRPAPPAAGPAARRAPSGGLGDEDFFSQRLDDMHREAMGELCRRVAAREPWSSDSDSERRLG